MNLNNNILTGKFLIVCFVTFAITFGLSFLFFNRDTQDREELTATNTSGAKISDTEIALIFFGCSTCPAATDDKIPEVLSELSAKLSKKATAKGYGYILIGTSNEWEIGKGLDYLRNIAAFDEISVGNWMANTTLQRYVWETFDHPLSAATPQVIISKRTYATVTSGKRNIIHPEIISEEIIIRKIGVEGMEQLLDNKYLFNSL